MKSKFLNLVVFYGDRVHPGVGEVAAAAVKWWRRQNNRGGGMMFSG